MDDFKVLYYPDCECAPLTLAKSILVFDEITFYDHPSLKFGPRGSIGHESQMRGLAPSLNKEGYALNVLAPPGGPIEGDLRDVINVDLANEDFRKTYIQLVQNDPTFLLSKVKGQYGKYQTEEKYRKRLLELGTKDFPTTIEELSGENTDELFPPELIAGLVLAQDSYNLNYSSYLAEANNLSLFGDLPGMNMMLKSKLGSAPGSKAKGISHQVAFTLLEQVIPNDAFRGKKLVDIVRFRNETEKDREKFKEKVLEVSLEIDALSEADKQTKAREIVHTRLLPEAREYQNKIADSWTDFFADSSKDLLKAHQRFAEIIVTILPVSLSAAILAGAAEFGIQVGPHIIDLLREKEKIDRRNPYSYLMKFR